MEGYEGKNRIEEVDALILVLSRDSQYGKGCAAIHRAASDRGLLKGEALYIQSIPEAEDVLSKFHGHQVEVYIDDSVYGSDDTLLLLNRVLRILKQSKIDYIIMTNSISSTGGKIVETHCKIYGLLCSDVFVSLGLIYGNVPGGDVAYTLLKTQAQNNRILYND